VHRAARPFAGANGIPNPMRRNGSAIACHAFASGHERCSMTTGENIHPRKERVMNGLPLHPAVVHLPIGLAVALPLLAAGLAWAILTRRLPHGVWLVIVGVQVAMLAAGFVALNTGERDEERVEKYVAETHIEAHEASAQQFMVVLGASLLVSILALAFRRGNAARTMIAAAAALTIVVTGMALRVGHAGGQLVYVHGAAQAHVTAPQAAEVEAEADDD
jgi:uncharacterized membrane protein